MVINDYLMTMNVTLRVGVAELKAHLSRYLREVRLGERVVVCDRDHPIAELVPVDTPANAMVVTRPAALPWPPAEMTRALLLPGSVIEAALRDERTADR